MTTEFVPLTLSEVLARLASKLGDGLALLADDQGRPNANPREFSCGLFIASQVMDVLYTAAGEPHGPHPDNPANYAEGGPLSPEGRAKVAGYMFDPSLIDDRPVPAEAVTG